jgi:broad specificity phosphatase PhoE
MLRVLLVRHVDIDLPRASPDPALNVAGRLRAQTLSYILDSARLSSIFTSNFLRTKQTVAPIALRFALQPQLATDTLIEELLAGADSQVVLVAGHSNTLPRMMAALGVTPPLPVIDEPEFDNLFVVTADPSAHQTALIHLKYGPGIIVPVARAAD